jgi:polyferredoxin
MDKMRSPRGLIRFATENGLAQGLAFRAMLARVLRPRVLVYGAVLGAIVIAFVASLALRSPFRVDVVRDRGALARLVGDGAIENVYRLQVMNATESPQRYRVRVAELDGATVASRAEVEVGAAQSRWLPLSVQLGPEAAATLGAGSHRLQFVIERLPSGSESAAQVREKSTFVVPR